MRPLDLMRELRLPWLKGHCAAKRASLPHESVAEFRAAELDPSEEPWSLSLAHHVGEFLPKEIRAGSKRLPQAQTLDRVTQDQGGDQSIQSSVPGCAARAILPCLPCPN